MQPGDTEAYSEVCTKPQKVAIIASLGLGEAKLGVIEYFRLIADGSGFQTQIMVPHPGGLVMQEMNRPDSRFILSVDMLSEKHQRSADGSIALVLLGLDKTKVTPGGRVLMTRSLARRARWPECRWTLEIFSVEWARRAS